MNRVPLAAFDYKPRSRLSAPVNGYRRMANKPGFLAISPPAGAATAMPVDLLARMPVH
jgi:hypothetical protein